MPGYWNTDPVVSATPSGGNVLNGILGGLPLVGGLLSGVSQIFTNARNRSFQREMYNQQRQDALEDWRLMNSYNHPAQQMQRLKEAGLNPHLMYGQGTLGNSQAGVRPSNFGSGGANSPNFSFDPSSLFYSVDLKLKNQQLENAKVTNAAIISEIARKNASTAGILQNTARSQYDLQYLSDTRNMSMDVLNAQLQRLNIGNKVMLDANERAEAMNAQNLQQGVIRIAQMRQQTANSMQEYLYWHQKIRAARLDNELREWSVRLSREGVRPNDPLWQRKIAEFLGDPASVKGAQDNLFGGDESMSLLDRIFGKYNKKPW